MQRYPSLVVGEIPLAGVAGWDVKVNQTGLPFSWTPLGAADVAGMRLNDVRIEDVDEAALKAFRAKSIAVRRKGAYVPGKDLETMLQLVFGLR